MDMATRTYISGQSPTAPPMPYTKSTWEPREERVRIPRSAQSNRPSPVGLRNPTPRGPTINSNVVELAVRESVSGNESPRRPEIVDLAAPNTWPRRGMASLKRGPSRRTAVSPSIYSTRSPSRQSEMSFGILDYYTRDHSPLHSLEYPPVTASVDPAIECFDFQLPSLAPAPLATNRKPLPPPKDSHPHVKAGAERAEPPLIEPSTPASDDRSVSHKKHYSLFPTIKEPPEPAEITSGSQSPSQMAKTPTNIRISDTAHPQPNPAYRPRKESVTSTRSRKDSFTSFRSNRQIPLRILSSSSTTSGGKTDSTISQPSPQQRSRWSDETITSPTVATTPGPRTSFGSLLAAKNSAQYPACFFEDDDEEAPLRRKFAWKRTASLPHESVQTKKRRGRYDEDSIGMKLKRIILCGSCWSSRHVTEML